MLNNEKTAISQPQLAQINLTGLPSPLQLELIDFYGFLIQKYRLNEKAPEPQTAFKRFFACSTGKMLPPLRRGAPSASLRRGGVEFANVKRYMHIYL